MAATCLIGYACSYSKEEARSKKRLYSTGSPTLMAILHARAGERDQAFEWFEKVYEDREPSLLWLKVTLPI